MQESQFVCLFMEYLYFIKNFKSIMKMILKFLTYKKHFYVTFSPKNTVQKFLDYSVYHFGDVKITRHYDLKALILIKNMFYICPIQKPMKIMLDHFLFYNKIKYMLMKETYYYQIHSRCSFISINL